MKSKKSVSYYIVLVIGVIALVNVLANRFFFRLDFTEDNRYTLSEATKDILKNLEEPVTITAYFSENLPPQLQQVKQDFKDLLTEYSSISRGMVVYEFVDPLEDPQIEQKALQAGIMESQIQVREENEIKVQKAFLGAIVQLGENSEVIPVIQSSEGMEYHMTSNIKKLTVIDKPLVGILQGHGEKGISNLLQVNSLLSVLYEVEEVTLNDTTNELDKFNTVVIIAPTDSFPSSHLNQIDNYLAQGKNLVIAMNRVEGKFEGMPRGEVISTGLESWLSEKGISVERNFIVDDNCGTVMATQQRGIFTMQTPVKFPYIPIVTNFSDHPITKGLEAIVFQFASSITFTGDSTIHYEPIVKTSSKSGTKSAPVTFDVNKEWTQADYPIGNLTIGAVAEGKLVGEKNSKLVLFSDGDFCVSEANPRQRQQQQVGDNSYLLANSIDWLSDDTGLIELRTQGVTARPLDEMENSRKTLLKYLNFLLPIILILIFGFIRNQRNRTLRIKRMEVDYV